MTFLYIATKTWCRTRLAIETFQQAPLLRKENSSDLFYSDISYRKTLPPAERTVTNILINSRALMLTGYR